MILHLCMDVDSFNHGLKRMELIDGMKPWLVLGEIADVDAPWYDYAQLGVSNSDIPALLSVLKDPSYKSADDDSAAIWVPVHAWRALGQVGSAEDSQALIEALELWIDDDWAVAEFSKVLSMLGIDALSALTLCLQNLKVSVYVRSVVADAMMMLAKQKPQQRSDVVDEFMSYLRKPDLSQPLLNGLVITNLVDLAAVEAIDLIRHIYDLGCVDQSCAGDIFEVEEALGLPSSYNEYILENVELMQDVLSQHDEIEALSPMDIEDYDLPSTSCVGGDLGFQTPIAYSQQHDASNLHYSTAFMDSQEHIVNYLERYCYSSGVTNSVTLDGFLSALACSPIMLPPAVWFMSLWGEDRSADDAYESSVYQTILIHHDLMLENLKQSVFNATFCINGSSCIADQNPQLWCQGFLRAVSLWGGAASDKIIRHHLAIIEKSANGLSLWQDAASDSRSRVDCADSNKAQKILDRQRHQVLDSIEASVMQIFELLRGENSKVRGSFYMQGLHQSADSVLGEGKNMNKNLEVCDTAGDSYKRKKHCLN